MEGVMLTSHDRQLRTLLLSVMPGGPSDLTEFAAHSALNELICNWSAALGNGHTLPQLLTDIDAVIEILSQFRAKCLSAERL